MFMRSGLVLLVAQGAVRGCDVDAKRSRVSNAVKGRFSFAAVLTAICVHIIIKERCRGHVAAGFYFQRDYSFENGFYRFAGTK